MKKKIGQNKGRVFRIVLKIVLCISSGFKYQLSENLNKNKIFSNKFWAKGNRYFCRTLKIDLFVRSPKFLYTIQRTEKH